MKSKLLRDFKILFFISRRSMVNRIRLIFESPLKAVFSSLKWVAYFAMMLMPLLIILVTRSGSSEESPFHTLYESARPYAGGLILVVLLLIVFLSLKKAVDNYKPSIFKPADANLVFTAPVHTRSVYLFAIIRAMFGNLMSVVMILCFFLIMTASFQIPLIPEALPFSIIGLFAFGIFMQTFRFFIYSLNKKLKSDRGTTICFYTILSAVVLLVLWRAFPVRTDIRAVFSALNAPFLELIPVAGWAKGLVTGLIYPNAQIIPLAVLSVVFAAASLFFSVKLADNFYEDTVLAIDETVKLQNVVKSGRTDELMAYAARGKNHKQTTISFRGTGTRVFLWKNLLIYKKNVLTKPISSFLTNALPLAVGLYLAFFYSPNMFTNYTILFPLITFFISSTMSGMPSPISVELKHFYFYLLPGKTRHKILFTSLEPIIKWAVILLLLSLPSLFTGRIDPLSYLVSIAAAMSIRALPVLSGVIIAVLFPDDEKLRKNPFMAMLRGLFVLVYYIPGAILCVLALLPFLLTGQSPSVAAGLAGFFVGNLVAAFLLLLLSEKLFSRLEYK